MPHVGRCAEPSWIRKVLAGRARNFCHRYAYERVHGLIPDGMQVDHICIVTSCVSPKHLQLVTQAQNLRLARIRVGDGDITWWEAAHDDGLAVEPKDLEPNGPIARRAKARVVWERAWADFTPDGAA